MAKNILIKGVNWVGDTILTLPAIQLIKEKLYPDSTVTLLIKQPLSSLFEDNPYIDRLIPYHFRNNPVFNILDRIALIRKLRKTTFDTAIVLPNSFDAAFLIFCSNSAERIGYAGDARSVLLKPSLEKPRDLEDKHQVYHYYYLLRDFLPQDTPLPELKLIITPDKQERIKKTFLKENQKPYIGLNPGATYGTAKRWPPEKYIELGKTLTGAYGYHLILFGSKEEEALNARIEKEIGSNVINVAGKTSLYEAAALLKECTLLVTNDTGLMHIAAAVKTPAVAIFGPTREQNTAPLYTHRIVRCQEELPCVPCMQRECPLKHHKCMRLISHDMVLQSIKELL